MVRMLVEELAGTVAVAVLTIAFTIRVPVTITITISVSVSVSVSVSISVTISVTGGAVRAKSIIRANLAGGAGRIVVTRDGRRARGQKAE